MDEDAYAFDAYDKEAEDNGRIFEKEWVGQEAEYESPGNADEQDEVDEDDNATAAVLGKPAGEEVEDDVDARETDKEVVHPSRLYVDILFQLGRDA